MKTLRILLFLVCAAAANAQTNVLYFKVGDILSGAGSPNLPNLKVVLTDTTEDPRIINGILISPQPKTATSKSDGKAYFTNVIWGTYSVKLVASPEVSFDIQVETNTTGIVDGATLTSITNVPNPISDFYTKVQVDALFADFTGGVSLDQLLSTSNSLQSQITGGGATTLVVTSIVNSATGVVYKVGSDLNFNFSPKGTNDIQTLEQPLINSASNALAASSATLGANLTNDVNTTSNALTVTAQGYATAATNALNTAAWQYWPYYSVVAGETAAQIQATANSMTNGGVLLFSPTNYPINANIIITNGPILIQGNGATLTFDTSLTNAMLTATNGKNLTVRDLVFNGQIIEPYSSSTYFWGPADYRPWTSLVWSNRTGIRVDGVAGATIEGCGFIGWSGQGALMLNSANVNAKTTGRCVFRNNWGATNLITVYAVGVNYESPGYNHSDSSLWQDWEAEYSIISGNRCWGCQVPIVATAGNCVVILNECNSNYTGMAVFGGNNSGHGNYSFNSFNHNIHGFFGDGIAGGQMGKVHGNTFYQCNDIVFRSCTLVDFAFNSTQFAGYYFTNNATGFCRFNVWQGGLIWGTDIATNFDPKMVVYGNAGENATNTDGSTLSQLIFGNGTALTNLSPSIATNGASASDGTVFAKTGNNIKLISASGSGTVTSVDVAEQGRSSSGAINTSGTVTLTRNGNDDFANFGVSNASFVKIDQWMMRTNPADHSLTISNGVFGANILLTTNGIFSVNGAPMMDATSLLPGELPYIGANTNFLGSTNNTEFEIVLAPSSNATNYPIDFANARKVEVITANTNANFTFLNAATNHSIDLYVNALTSTVPCVVTFPAHIRLNHFASLSVSNTTAVYYHIDFWNGTDPTNAVVTGGDYYQIQ